MMKTRIASLVLLMLTACVPVSVTPTLEEPHATASTIQSEEVEPMPLETPLLNATVSQAVRDLATHLGVSPAAVTVVDAQNVIWADSALGCPEPDTLYMQVPQEGMRIRLQAGAEVYQYHSSTTRKPFLCQNPTEPLPSSATRAPATRNLAQSPAQQAVQDLAARLQIDVDQIEVVRSVEVNWPDGSLGCPQPGMRYTQVVVNGTFVELRVGDQVYNYHSGAARPPFLCISKDEVLPEDLPQY